ncbi:MAG: lipoprotein-releasing ABC transporter permease subunit [Pseudomonadota bacterium]
MSKTDSTSAPFGAFERTLAWRYLRARREHGGASLISIISFVGIALAVWALITIMSVMGGFRATLLDALLGGQPHVYVSTTQLTQEDADAVAAQIRDVQGVITVTPYIEETVLVTHNGRSNGALVKSIPAESLASQPFIPDDGETAYAAGFGEGRKGGNVILMGAFLAADLGVLPGDTVNLVAPQVNATIGGSTPRNKNYVVGDVFKTGSVELDKAYIFMPLEQGQVFFKYPDSYELLDIRLRDPEASDAAMQRIFSTVAQPLRIFDWKNQRASYLNALNIERMMMMIVMMILVSITALNIITGVVMLVKNKTRDIAILRTIGAGRTAMMRVFLMVGATLGMAGALTGLVLGLLTVLNIGAVEAFLNTVVGLFGGGRIFDADVYGLEGLPADLDVGMAIFATVWAIAMSVVVTVWPAWRAADLDPVEALRFE